MRYDYLARDGEGREIKGTLSAADQSEAVRSLAEQGLTVVQLELQGGARPRVARKTGGRIRMADQVVLLRELATLLAAGVPLGETLPSLAQAYEQQALGPALDSLHGHVRGGGKLSEALQDPRLGLPSFVLALAQAGEASGDLARSLEEAANQLELDRKVQEDLRSALIYPMVLVVAGILAVFIIFVGVVPKFAPILRSARADVPEISRLTIMTGLFVRDHLNAFLLGGAAVIGTVVSLFRQAVWRHRALQWLARLPGVGPWLIQAEVGRWATVLGALLDNRVPIVRAMEIATGVLNLDLLRSGLERATRSLQQGLSLTQSLESQSWFPPTRLNLIRVGEQSGELHRMLLTLGQAQTETARTTQRRLLTLIEPVAILVIGAVIGFIMVAVMLAITSMNSSVGGPG